MVQSNRTLSMEDCSYIAPAAPNKIICKYYYCMAYRREIVHPPLKIDLEPLAMKCAESKANPEANSGRKP